MAKQTIFIVFANSDRTEGKGVNQVVAHFTSKDEALKCNDDSRFYKKYGVMGTKYDPEYNIKAMTLFDNADDFLNQTEEDMIRLRALNKLTPEERHVLGLSQ